MIARKVRVSVELAIHDFVQGKAFPPPADEKLIGIFGHANRKETSPGRAPGAYQCFLALVVVAPFNVTARPKVNGRMMTADQRARARVYKNPRHFKSLVPCFISINEAYDESGCASVLIEANEVLDIKIKSRLRTISLRGADGDSASLIERMPIMVAMAISHPNHKMMRRMEVLRWLAGRMSQQFDTPGSLRTMPEVT